MWHNWNWILFIRLGLSTGISGFLFGLWLELHKYPDASFIAGKKHNKLIEKLTEVLAGVAVVAYIIGLGVVILTFVISELISLFTAFAGWDIEKAEGLFCFLIGIICCIISHFIAKHMVDNRVDKALSSSKAKRVAAEMDQNPIVTWTAARIMNEHPACVKLYSDSIKFYNSEEYRDWLVNSRYAASSKKKADYEARNFRKRGKVPFYEAYHPIPYDVVSFQRMGYTNMSWIQLHAFTDSVGKRITGYSMTNNADINYSETHEEDNYVSPGSTVVLSGTINGETVTLGPTTSSDYGMTYYDSQMHNTCEFRRSDIDQLENYLKYQLEQSRMQVNQLREW